MLITRSRFLGCLLMVVILVCPVAAQQGAPPAPLPPVSSSESGGQQASADTPAGPPVQPDTRPLSGAQAFTLGSLFGGRSFLTASIRLSQLADSNSRSATSTTPDWTTVTNVGGQLSLQRSWAHAQLGLNYTLGAILHNSQTNSRGQFHNFDINQVFTHRRVSLLFANNFSYLPESSIGSGGIAGIGSGLGGSNLPGFGGGLGFGGGGAGGTLIPGITPGQTILFGQADRITNTSVAQLQYNFSPRSSLTASASFGLLRFQKSGFVDSDSYSFQAGYDHSFTARDTLGVIYFARLFRFGGTNQGSDNHSVNLAYGRKITGRIALQIAGGPSILLFPNPTAGSGRSVTWNMMSAFLYSYPVARVGIRYFHGMNSGSGVLLGSEMDRVDFNWNRTIGRVWMAGLRIGYAHNRSIQQLSSSPQERTFNGVDMGFNLNRHLGRKGQIGFIYNYQHQISNFSICTPGTTVCGTVVGRHHFGLNFTWGFGPYSID